MAYAYETMFSLAFICIVMSIVNSLAKLHQTWKIRKHKKGGTVSVGYFTVSLITAFVFFLYAVSLWDTVLIIGGLIGMATTSSVIVAYNYYDGGKKI